MHNIKQSLFAALVLLMSGYAALWGQDIEKDGKESKLDTVFTLTDYNAGLPTGLDILKQDVNTKPVKKYHSSSMIGVRYGVNWSGAHITPDVGAGNVLCPNNFSIVYTYYNDLWDMLDNFGTQAVARLGREGFTTEYLGTEYYTVGELDLLCNLRLNFSSFRILVNVGPYAGYRISNGRDEDPYKYPLPGNWNYIDNRYDYGLMFGGGLGIVFKPFEFHLECNYKWGLSSYYHTYYYHDEYWLFAYPRVFMFSGTLYFKL